MLATIVELPIVNRVVTATEEVPYLAFFLRLDIPVVRDILNTEERKKFTCRIRRLGLEEWLSGRPRSNWSARVLGCCSYRDCSQERPRAGLGSFPRSGDAQHEQTGQRVSGSRAGPQFECSALVRAREPNHFRASR